MVVSAIISLTVVRVIVGLTQVIAPLIVIRLLPQDEFGVYQGFLAITSMLVVLASLGFDASVTYFLPKSPGREKDLLRDTTAAVFLTSVGVIICFYTVSVAGLIGKQTETAIFQCALYVFIFANLNWVENYLIVKNRIKKVAAYAMSRLCIRIIAVIGAALLWRESDHVIWALILVELMRFTAVFILVIKRRIIKLNTRPRLNIEQVRYAIPLGLTAVCQAIGQHAGKVLVLTTHGPNVLAFYAVALFLQMIARTIKVGIQEAIFPEMVRVVADRDRLFELHKQSTVLQFAMFISLFVLLNMRAESFLLILFPPSYLEAIVVVKIFSLLLLRRAFNFDSLFRASGISSYALTGSLVGLVVNVVVTAGLWPVISWYAAAVGYVFSQFFVEAMYFRKAQTVLKAKLLDLVDVVGIAKCVIASVAATALLPVSDHFMPRGNWWFLLESTVYLATAFVLMTMLGVQVVADSFARAVSIVGTYRRR